MRFLLLTGLSGAGKTSATRYLEDMGVFCVDNLPPMMMLKLMEACQSTAMHCPLVAFAVDVRSGEFFDAKAVQRLITETRGLGYQIETLFMEASDDVLVSRYKETRRDHPLASESVSLTEAIAQEREMLTPLRETANYVIDTSFLRPRALQRKLAEIVKSDGGEAPLRLEVLSFGFKRGLPRQGDLVFDVRFLPNPYYEMSLREKNGTDPDVRDYVFQGGTADALMKHLSSLIDFLLPRYMAEGKSNVIIGIGCTGGKHRSVAIAEELSRHLRGHDYGVVTMHRDYQR